MRLAAGSTSLPDPSLVRLSVFLSRQLLSLWYAGDSCEAQILLAGHRYLDRPTVLENILNDLFHVFRYETCQNLKTALDILLLAMERFVVSLSPYGCHPA